MTFHQVLRGVLIAFVLVYGQGCRRNKTPPATPTKKKEASERKKNSAPPPSAASVASENTHSAPPPDSSVRFIDATDASGIRFAYSNGRSAQEFAILESLGGGVGLFDIDLDGNLDVMFAGGGNLDDKQVTSRPCALFRNLGNWRFEDTTVSAGAQADTFFTHGVYPGDFDGDGFDDLAVSGYGGVQLLRNAGDGTYIEAGNLGTETPNNWSSSLAWCDINCDGLLDLYVTNYVDWSWQKHPFCPGKGDAKQEVCAPSQFSGMKDILYLNSGEELVRDSSSILPIQDGGKGLGVIILDLNQDGRDDVYVANDTVDNFLYLSNDDGWEESAIIAGVSGDDRGIGNGSMGIATLDADGNALPDLFVSNFERELSAMYRNEGDGLFSYVSRAAGFASYEAGFVGFGTVPIDLDFDGDQDLAVANGHVSYASPHAPYRQLPLLFENVVGKFHRVTDSGYFSEAHTGRGLATGDLDNDGAEDLVFSNLEESSRVVRATQRPPNYRRIQLVGTKSNRPAFGAKLSISLKDKTLTRFVYGGGSYLSSSDRRITFAVPAEFEGAVTVAWPRSPPESFTLEQQLEWVLVEGSGTPVSPPVE